MEEAKKIDLAEDFVKLINDKLKNPNLSTEQLRSMGYLSQALETCISGILYHPNTPQDVFDRWSKSKDPNFRIAVAKCDKTPTNILSTLSDDQSERVRVNVARNPNTPEETIVLLSLDDSLNVREAVRNNPSSPRCTMRFLGSKYSGAKKRNTTKPILTSNKSKGFKL